MLDSAGAIHVALEQLDQRLTAVRTRLQVRACDPSRGLCKGSHSAVWWK